MDIDDRIKSWAGALAVTGLLLPATPGFSQEPEEIEYQVGADSRRQDGVPRGEVTKHEWTSAVYAGTTREYSVYIPAQYDPKTPAAVMIFQDGHAYLKEDGDFRTPIVFDNLIHQGAMPVTIGIFIDPGHRGESRPENPFQNNNRTFEYDELTEKYARLLIEELLPEVGEHYALTDDPKLRAIAGLSSGGICAFTAAWQRPDVFQKVVSHIGSFTNIRGGHVYPALIRKQAQRDIKVFLQDGSRDLNNAHGNWWLSNLQMASALEFRGYDYKFVRGTGGHDGKHGGAIFPETLRWLWAAEAPGPKSE